MSSALCRDEVPGKTTGAFGTGFEMDRRDIAHSCDECRHACRSGQDNNLPDLSSCHHVSVLLDDLTESKAAVDDWSQLGFCDPSTRISFEGAERVRISLDREEPDKAFDPQVLRGSWPLSGVPPIRSACALRKSPPVFRHANHIGNPDHRPGVNRAEPAAAFDQDSVVPVDQRLRLFPRKAAMQLPGSCTARAQDRNRVDCGMAAGLSHQNRAIRLTRAMPRSKPVDDAALDVL